MNLNLTDKEAISAVKTFIRLYSDKYAQIHWYQWAQEKGMTGDSAREWLTFRLVDINTKIVNIDGTEFQDK